MNTKRAFQAGAKAAWATFKDAVVVAEAISIHNDGFTAKTETSFTCNMIRLSVTEKDVSDAKKPDIQSSDIKCLVKGDEMQVAPETIDVFSFESNRHTVVSYKADPLGIVYTFFVRKT